MAFEDVLRNVALTLVRFSVFSGSAIVFGAIPIALAVLRPALAAGSDPGLTRVGRRLESFVRVGVIALAFGTALGLLIQATLVSQVTGSVLGPGDVESVLATSFGRWQAARLPLAAVVWFVVCPQIRRLALGPATGPAPRIWWAIWSAAAVVLLATSTMSGHAAVSAPRGVAISNDLVHLAAAGTWFTGILILAVVLPDSWRGGERRLKLAILARAVNRFSRVAMISIGVVAVTGTINSFMNVARPADLVESGYGRILALKLGFFGVILVLGGVNHFVLRSRLESSAAGGTAGADAERLFRKTITVELVIALILIALTGLLVGLGRTRESVAAGDGADVRSRQVVSLSRIPPTEPKPAASASASNRMATDGPAPPGTATTGDGPKA